MLSVLCNFLLYLFVAVALPSFCNFCCFTEMLNSCPAPVNGDSDSSGDADVCRGSESEGDSSEDTAADSSSVAVAESTVDNCNLLDHCDSTGSPT